MKVMFLTTYGVPIEKEHFFTKGVYRELKKYYSSTTHSVKLATIIPIDKESHEEYQQSENHLTLYLQQTLSREEKIERIAHFFRDADIDVIHSQMVEGIDVKGAELANIPIVHTVHIGGFICPRGGGNGFLDHNDCICHTSVGRQCVKCMLRDFPYWRLASILYTLIPRRLKIQIKKIKKNKKIFYLSPLLDIDTRIDTKKEQIYEYKTSHIIAASQLLADKLRMNGLHDNVTIIPHGVAKREKLAFPEIKGQLKLYYLGRIQYSKGLHVVLKALEGIDASKYQLHVIGDAEPQRKEQRYYKKIKRMAKGKNVVFHGRIANEHIETVVKDCHVALHSTLCLEVYGISIAESLSMGRPVLSTRCGGAEMQITDGINGWLIKPNDIEALREKLLYLIENTQEIKKCAGCATLPHPLDKYINRLDQLYSSLL